jgi:hypothetical protein
MNSISVAVDAEGQGLTVRVQVRHPFLGDGVRMVVNHIHEHRKMLLLKGSLCIAVHHVQLCLADLHGSNIVTDENIPSLSEFHERIYRFQQARQDKQCTNITKQIKIVPSILPGSSLLISKVRILNCSVFGHLADQGFVFT